MTPSVPIQTTVLTLKHVAGEVTTWAPHCENGELLGYKILYSDGMVEYWPLEEAAEDLDDENNEPQPK